MAESPSNQVHFLDERSWVRIVSGGGTTRVGLQDDCPTPYRDEWATIQEHLSAISNSKKTREWSWFPAVGSTTEFTYDFEAQCSFFELVFHYFKLQGKPLLQPSDMYFAVFRTNGLMNCAHQNGAWFGAMSNHNLVVDTEGELHMLGVFDSLRGPGTEEIERQVMRCKSEVSFLNPPIPRMDLLAFSQAARKLNHVVESSDLMRKFREGSPDPNVQTYLSVFDEIRDVAVRGTPGKNIFEEHSRRFRLISAMDGVAVDEAKTRAHLVESMKQCGLWKRSLDGAGSTGLIVWPDCTINLENLIVETTWGEFRLTELEQRLLIYLKNRPGEVISNEELLRSVWGYASSVESRAIDHAIKRLRSKMEPNPKSPERLRRVYGKGIELLLPNTD